MCFLILATAEREFKMETTLTREKPTQKEQVLNHLRKYGFITNFDALTNYRICRLSAIIKDLRNESYNIATLLQNGKVNKYGIYVLLAEPNQKLNMLDAKKNLENYLKD